MFGERLCGGSALCGCRFDGSRGRFFGGGRQRVAGGGPGLTLRRIRGCRSWSSTFRETSGLVLGRLLHEDDAFQANAKWPRDQERDW